MKLLFLTCFESTITGGIFQSQVKQLLLDIRRQNPEVAAITLLIVLPLFSVNRRGVHFKPLELRPEMQKLRQELADGGVKLRLAYVPFLGIRPSIYLPVPVCMLALGLVVLPVLLYHQVRHAYDVMHCRSYAASLSALLVKRLAGPVRVVFDVRGFYPEEAVVHKAWKLNSASYHFWKRLEKWMLGYADKVICLSEPFAEYVSTIAPKAKTAVIYASINVARFAGSQDERLRLRASLGLSEQTVFVFSGGLGSWHDPVLLCRLFHSLARNVENARLLVLSDIRREEIDVVCEQCDVPRDRVLLKTCSPAEVPAHLRACDWALVPLRHIAPQDSHVEIIARTMIGLKVGEYLAAGLPLIVNESIHGIRTVMEKYQIGFTFQADRLDEAGHKLARWCDPEVRKRCQEAAGRHFNVADAARAYSGVYRDICSTTFDIESSRAA